MLHVGHPYNTSMIKGLKRRIILVFTCLQSKVSDCFFAGGTYPGIPSRGAPRIHAAVGMQVPQDRSA